MEAMRPAARELCNEPLHNYRQDRASPSQPGSQSALQPAL